MEFFSIFWSDITSRINKLEDMKKLRLQYLRNHNKDTYNAVMWLRENKNRFKHPVHEPILLLVFLIRWLSSHYLLQININKSMNH